MPYWFHWAPYPVPLALCSENWWRSQLKVTTIVFPSRKISISSMNSIVWSLNVLHAIDYSICKWSFKSLLLLHILSRHCPVIPGCVRTFYCHILRRKPLLPPLAHGMLILFTVPSLKPPRLSWLSHQMWRSRLSGFYTWHQNWNLAVERSCVGLEKSCKFLQISFHPGTLWRAKNSQGPWWTEAMPRKARDHWPPHIKELS